MAYGLQIRNGANEVRLDTSDREIRFVAFYTGSTAVGAVTTISVPGLNAGGTWGLNDSEVSFGDTSLAINSGNFTHTNNSTSSARSYAVQVFRI